MCQAQSEAFFDSRRLQGCLIDLDTIPIHRDATRYDSNYLIGSQLQNTIDKVLPIRIDIDVSHLPLRNDN